MFAFALYLFHVFYEEAKREAIVNSQKVQLVYAQQAAREIEEFFNGWIHRLTFFAEQEDIARLSGKGKEIMKIVYKGNKDIISNITRVDEAGRIIYTYPESAEIIGREIALKPHLRDSLRKHKPVVSDIIRTVHGYEAVALHIPVMRDKVYTGTLAVTIDFQTLAKRYIEGIKIGNTGYAWIISRDGTELYCPVPGHTGKSVFENCRDFPSILAMAEDMIKGNEGTAVYDFDQVRGEHVENERKHAVYLPVRMADNYWSIVVAISENEIITSLEGFRNKLIGVIAFLLLGGVLVSYYGSRAWFIVREDKERARAEAAVRESEGKLAGIIEFLPDATFVVDLEGRVIAWNRAIEEMTGISKEEMIGKGDHMVTSPFYGGPRKHLLSLIDSEDKETEAQYLNLQRKGNIVHAEAFAPALYNGKGAYVFAAVAPLLDQQGNRIGAVESVRDITEQKRAEEEKQALEERVQRMEKMEAIGTLAGGIAHDLNNVLGIVTGQAELLLYDMDEANPLRSNVLKIQKGGDRAAAIVEDLLALARRGVADVESLNLNRVVRMFAKTPEFEKLKSSHPSIVIRTDLEPDLLKIAGSSLHITKTLYNLVLNACEAMPNGGVLAVKTANVYLDKPISGYDEVCEGDYVVLSVSDTGEGIAENDLKRIFEPFYTKKVMGKKGTGLGLAVVWGTVKDHNGYINVVSEHGKGTVFTLYFPVAREVIPSGKAAVSLSEYMGKGETILVVDDMKDQRDLAAEMLKRLNYKVVTLASGEEACEYLKSNAADLIVLDMIMATDMDGLDTYRSILELHPGQKAVIVSGFSESERVTEAQKLGAGPYIKKPYMLEKLGLAIRKELDKEQTQV
jgi:PAS domain S-box-containing protein